VVRTPAPSLNTAPRAVVPGGLVTAVVITTCDAPALRNGSVGASAINQARDDRLRPSPTHGGSV